ncbi:hypothetical protein SNE40_021228 [Patella caerulea]|uniref:Peptidase aspartic putative domain-containing protein n=1 Tax=Patella caerulea TaxID=87958 RepID=A0AAN8IWF0_PATCE
MIVPVWLSNEDNPGHEQLTYLLQDSQSDTPFCTNNSANELDVNGVSAHLMLSTMSAENQLVDCRKISGLQVRAYNSDPASKRISLPSVFTRDKILTNRSHIPTPEMARKWPHLSKIASDIPPLMDCEVGVLIGYDCPKALTPREVIPHDNTGPFALKTDLGWGIVGVVSGLPDESEFDAIGSSSQVFSCSTDEAEVRFSLRNKAKELINPAEVLKMMEMDFSERSLEGPGISRDDQQFLDKMNSSIRMIENHYEMPLLFRNERPFLPNNRHAVISRLNLLAKRFQHIYG